MYNTIQFMLQEATERTGTTYVTIIGGDLRTRAQEGDIGVVRREYEQSDGTYGVKFERIHESISGYITNIEFIDTDFGKNCQVTIGEETLSLKTEDRFFASFAKVAKNIDFKKEVLIKPYDFKDESKTNAKGDAVRVAGLTIKQDGEKVAPCYWDGKKAINGIPEMKEKKPDSDDWKIFFTTQKKFFIKELESLEFPEEVGSALDVKETAKPTKKKEEISVEDVPW